MMAGSGRCNLTHSGEIKDFFNHYGQHGRFLKTALHAFTHLDLVEFFTSRGLRTIIDKNGKVFPFTEKSSDVLEVLMEECSRRKVVVKMDERVTSVKKEGELFVVETAHSEFQCLTLVIATGGLSCPSTGSSGDGYSFARSFQHSIVPLKPSLSPVFIHFYSMTELAGVSLVNKRISLFRDNKKIAEHSGDIGFTHKGLSGPGILDFSRYIQAGDVLNINFLDINPDALRLMILQVMERSGKMSVQTFLKSFDLPRSLARILLEEAGISPDSTMATLTKEFRSILIRNCCEYPFQVERVGGFNMAMVTTGGVSLDEINPLTLESKLIPGLYFAGEVLDIDGDTGGYNLQAAFSTGYLAGSAVY